ncbi:hypothetical protein JTE88_08650 [Arcanobacterium phocisimile]|uniref:Uncharacterized protein n=1 Tax=Arcanobacterium phocisimile TaxID=1302235 RepID=A0ABX7IHW6_9ACTO|nr:hypothetical protein [Arcanobacterium phocisimile]QRV02124.1 hypothetical protein JTE88_08650 [Arcanobacterium phocisimile]
MSQSAHNSTGTGHIDASQYTNSRRVLRRWWATISVLVIALVTIVVAPAWRGMTIDNDGAVRVDPGHKTVVIGFSGVTWADISPEKTPALVGLVKRGASANVAVKTLGVTTCPNAGWLTLSQGVRAADPIAEGCAQPVTASSNGVLPNDVETARSEAEKLSPYDAPGTTLGDELARANISVATIGSGAALAARSSSNTALPHRYHADAKTEDGLTVNAAQRYPQVANADLVMIDMGRIDNEPSTGASAVGQTKSKGMLADLRAAFAAPAQRSPQASSAIAQLDQHIGELLEQIDPGTTIIVASLADSDTSTAHLQFFTATGTQIEPGTLAYTNSTRHRGLVQLTDLPQLIVTQLGLRPLPDFVGSAIAMTDTHQRAFADISATLRAGDARAIAVRPAVGPFYVLFSALAVIFLGWSGVRLWRAARGRQIAKSSRAHELVGLTVAIMPVASFIVNLLPWWNWTSPTVVFLLLVMTFSLFGAYMSVMSSWPAGAVALLSAGVLSVDVLTGSLLHSSSVLGDQPQQGGRFYGFSNAPFTVFAISMLWLTIVAVHVLREHHRQITVPGTVIVMGIVALILDGAGSLGADFGGVPALFIAFFVLFVALGGRTLTARTMIIVLGVGAGVSIGVAFIDWLRPQESWTHLARFFQSVIDGGAVAVVYRKLMAMLGSAPWFVWVIVVFVAATIWLYRSRMQQLFATSSAKSALVNVDPDIRWVDRSVLTLVLVAVALNDSGLVILLIGVAFGAPLSIVERQRASRRLQASEL